MAHINFIWTRNRFMKKKVRVSLPRFQLWNARKENLFPNEDFCLHPWNHFVDTFSIAPFPKHKSSEGLFFFPRTHLHAQEKVLLMLLRSIDQKCYTWTHDARSTQCILPPGVVTHNPCLRWLLSRLSQYNPVTVKWTHARVKAEISGSRSSHFS